MSDKVLYIVFLTMTVLIMAFVIVPLVRLVLFINPQTASVIMERSVLMSIWNSISLSFLTAIVAFIFGIPVAFLFAKKTFGKLETFVETIVDLPLSIPHTVVGIALLFVVGRKEIIGAFFYNTFGFQIAGTRVAIVIAMLFVSLPYTIDSAKEGFKRVDPSLEKVAMTLGAPLSSIFRTIYLPLSKSSILSGFLLTWARSISEFGAVIMLAYYPMTAPVKIYQAFNQSDLSTSGAIAAYLLVISLSIFLTFRFVAVDRKWKH